jgi:hypothetical protein
MHGVPVRFTSSVFINDETLLDVGFDAAQARLANRALSDTLTSASEDAYGEGVTELIRVGPGSALVTSKLVEVRFQNLVKRDDFAGLAMRWEATGPGGGLFPALDADITVTPAGEQITLLKITGTYRPPLGALGTMLDMAILHRIATSTIQTFLNRIAAALAHPPASAA